MSISNLFKKSESDTGKNKNKILIPLLIVLLIAGIVYLGYPLVFPDSKLKLPGTPTKKVVTPSSTPGFDAIFAISSLLSVVYLVLD